MNNTNKLSLWDRHADIDPKFTKSISGKDYSGTSPNAHHVIWCLTDLFGPVGQGFGWRVVSDAIEHFGDTAIHWCRIEFWHTDRANTFEAYGQTKMAYITANGKAKVDEDAPKKSLTDAITKAAAQIGVASNIFLGRWDDNKYVDQVQREFTKREQHVSKHAVDAAKKALEGAESLDDLRSAWSDLPKPIQASPLVIGAKDARKSKLEQDDKTPEPAGAGYDDEIPY